MKNSVLWLKKSKFVSRETKSTKTKNSGVLYKAIVVDNLFVNSESL